MTVKELKNILEMYSREGLNDDTVIYVAERNEDGEYTRVWAPFDANYHQFSDSLRILT